MILPCFPRRPEYEPAIQSLILETESVQRHGIIRVIRNTAAPYVNPGMNYVLWHGAISDAKLVTAAAPDRSLEKAPSFQIGSYMRGVVMAPEGHTSKYAIPNFREAFEFHAFGFEWTAVAHLRIGRLLKYLRFTHGRSLCPLAPDPINAALMPLFLEGAIAPQYAADTGSLAAAAMSTDVFDPTELNDAVSH